MKLKKDAYGYIYVINPKLEAIVFSRDMHTLHYWSMNHVSRHALRHTYVVLRMCSEQYAYCYVIHTACAACTLGGIVCSLGLLKLLMHGLMVRISCYS